MSINKLKNTWISNDTTNLQGTYNKVSILNEGKTELKGDTLVNSKLAINKNIDSVNDYKLDVGGNVNFTGNLYKNGTVFTSGISLADVQANANTFTNTNTFQNGILPCSGTRTTDIQIGGNNQLQYRQATSANNISIGDGTLAGDSDPLWTQYNTGKRNIGIGGQVLSRLDLGNDNIFLGYQSGQNCGSARLHSVGITPQRCIAIGTYSQKGNLYMNDSVSIGYNSLINASGPAPNNVMIGSNVGNGLTFQGSCVFIGANCAPTVNDNAIIAIGNQCLGGATNQFNSGTAIGFQAGYNNNNGQGGTFIGAEAGYSNTSGSNNTCIGLKAGRNNASGTLNYTVCIGFNSASQINNECVFGGEALSEQVFLTLPNKHRLSCNQTATGPTFGIGFRTNENIIIDNTITTINLPTPNSTGINQGAKYNLLRQSATSDITINAPSGQTIGFMDSTGTYTTASTYTLSRYINNISLLCVANSGTSWFVMNNMSNYLTSATASSTYLTSATASSTYLTQTNASSTYQTQSGMSSYLTSTITTNLTANSKTITPAQLGFLNNVSNQQLPTSAILNYGSGFLTSTISTNLTANSLTITPVQLSFLNKVLVAPSVNEGLIPKTAISNYTDFVQYNVTKTITGTYTFSANPIFNSGAIPLAAIADISITYMDLFNTQTADGTKTFTSPPVMSGALITVDTIPVSSINSVGLTGFVNGLIPSSLTNYMDLSNAQTVAGIKTFSSAPVMSGASISAGTIPLSAISTTLQTNYYKKGVDQTISNIFTFSTNPVFNTGAIPTTAISGYGSGYLLASDASTTYQTQSGMSSYLTTATASSTYQTQSGMTSYLTTATASSTYQTQTGMSSYQTTAGMSSYLTTATASSTYQTQSGMSSYQTTAGMSSYLTTSTASTTYVASSGNSTIDGIKTFSSPPVMSGASITSGTVSYTAINSSYTANSVATLAPTATSLSSPLSNYYTFTSATADTVITLPTITTNIIGCPLTFRRVGNVSFQLIIKTASSSNTTIIQRASIVETAQNTNYVLLATTNYVGTVMAISSTKWSVIT
jgi:hypothetical protein